MIPAGITAKLAKILPRLASEHDGEVIATVRAIGRTLAAAGLDWHAFAAAIATLASDAAPVASASWATDNPTAPRTPTRRYGMRLWDADHIEPWNRVAQHARMLDWTMPKAFGGRFLGKADRDRLKGFERGGSVSNADATWMEAVVAQAHRSVEAWRNRGKAAA